METTTEILPYNPVAYNPEVYLFCYASSNINYFTKLLNLKQPLLYVNAYVKNHVRVFAGNSKKWKGGIATLYPKMSSNVYGILITLTNEQLDIIDRHQKGYRREKIIATIEGSKKITTEIESYTYFKNNIQFSHMPSNEYLNSIDSMLQQRIGYKQNQIIIRGIVKNRLKGIGIWNKESGFKMKL